MNHQNDNGVTTRHPNLRNVELLTDMFGTNGTTLQPKANTNIEWESVFDGNNLHEHKKQAIEHLLL